MTTNRASTDADPPTGGRDPAPVIEINDVHKIYGEGDAAERALRGVSLSVDRGSYVAIVGPSGSGKSTLMHIIGCLDVPTAGRYALEGQDIGSLDDEQLAVIRNRKIGFVFQAFNLIPRMSTIGNVELPLAYAGVRKVERLRRARAALALMGLEDRANQMPNTLSGGQRQRVALARALVMSPSVLLADEPTGNLDSAATADLLGVFDRLHASGRTVVVVTHEAPVADRAERIVELKDGQILDDRRTTRHPASAGAQ